MKRVRPAPMGRAFRVVKRTAHLTVRVAERPLKIARVAAEGDAAAKPARARSRRGAHGRPARRSRRREDERQRRARRAARQLQGCQER